MNLWLLEALWWSDFHLNHTHFQGHHSFNPAGWMKKMLEEFAVPTMRCWNILMLPSGVLMALHAWRLVNCHPFLRCRLCTVYHNSCIFTICSCPTQSRHKFCPLSFHFPTPIFVLYRRALFLILTHSYWISIWRPTPVRLWICGRLVRWTVGKCAGSSAS